MHNSCVKTGVIGASACCARRDNQAREKRGQLKSAYACSSSRHWGRRMANNLGKI